MEDLAMQNDCGKIPIIKGKGKDRKKGFFI
jgi:hypothetical protein